MSQDVQEPAERPLAELMPFAGHLGIEVVESSADRVEGRLPWAAHLCTSGGILHGGALMALADSVGALCAVLNLPDGAGTSTIESKTNFFRGVRDGHVTALATPLHTGRSTIVVQTDLLDAAGKRVARVTQTQAVLAPRG
jgi:uncharacterized protein (TIGR00369 family)